MFKGYYHRFPFSLSPQTISSIILSILLRRKFGFFIFLCILSHYDHGRYVAFHIPVTCPSPSTRLWRQPLYTSVWVREGSVSITIYPRRLTRGFNPGEGIVDANVTRDIGPEPKLYHDKLSATWRGFVTFRRCCETRRYGSDDRIFWNKYFWTPWVK